MTAGAMSAVRSARSPIRSSPISATPARPAPRCARSTVTRVLTNAAGSKVTGVEYYDDKKEKQVQEASVVVLAAWAAQNPRLMLNSATDKHPKGPRQFERPPRQIHDGAFRLRHLGDVRRGRREPHGHDRRAVHVLRPLRQDQPQGRLRQHLHRRRHRAQDQRPRRLRQRPRPTCSGRRSPTS